MKKEFRRSWFTTKKLVLLGMMIAITVVLAYTPLGIIPIPPLSATIVHVPTIIISLLEGPIAGMIVGAAFGITTLVRAITAVNPIDKLFINPFVSILPRILIGIVTFYVYKGVGRIIKGKTTNNILATSFGAAAGSLINTIGVLFMLYVFYAKQVAEAVGKAAIAFLAGIGTTYGLVEMAVATVITLAIVNALRKVFYK